MMVLDCNNIYCEFSENKKCNLLTPKITSGFYENKAIIICLNFKHKEGTEK